MVLQENLQPSKVNRQYYDPSKEKARIAEKENRRLAYEMYSPVMKFPYDESSLKRNFDKYLEKQGSRLDQYAT